jgi:hypothetical protein
MPFHRSHNQAEQPKLQHPGYKFRLRSKTGLKVLEISPAQRARDNSQKESKQNPEAQATSPIGNATRIEGVYDKGGQFVFDGRNR